MRRGVCCKAEHSPIGPRTLRSSGRFERCERCPGEPPSVIHVAQSHPIVCLFWTSNSPHVLFSATFQALFRSSCSHALGAPVNFLSCQKNRKNYKNRLQRKDMQRFFEKGNKNKKHKQRKKGRKERFTKTKKKKRHRSLKKFKKF